jgi:signal peptidase II
MKAINAVPASRYSVFFAIAAAGCAVDLATKAWMFDWLGMPPGPSEVACAVGRDECPVAGSAAMPAAGRTEWLWNEVFGFQSSLNEGALFGMGQGMVLFFAAVSIGALIGILYWLFWTGAARDWLLTVSLGCISAGILGNLYDRLGLPGLAWVDHPRHALGERVHAVRDFVLFKIGSYSWPNFNLADSLLVCGAAILLWHALRPHKEADEAQPRS